MIEEYILTTRDNKWDYFTHFDEWLAEDRRLGHNCCGIVAAIAKTSPQLSDEVNIRITNQAIDAFLKAEPLGIYKKVSRGKASE